MRTTRRLPGLDRRALPTGPASRWAIRAASRRCLALSTDGRHLFVGNTGTQDISIVDTATLREVGGIYIQNAVNDLKIYHSPVTGHDYLLVTTRGSASALPASGTPTAASPGTATTRRRSTRCGATSSTGKVLPRAEQEVLGPFDAVDGTAEIKFRDMQNDIVLVDVGASNIPDGAAGGGPPSYLLMANRYEAHRGWVRYTSDTAESTYGDIKGDIPPDLMRVVGASSRADGDRRRPAVRDHAGQQPGPGVARSTRPPPIPATSWCRCARMPPVCSPSASPRAGRQAIYVANFLGGSLSIIDPAGGDSREVVVDPSVLRLPVPATNAERGEIVRAHRGVLVGRRHLLLPLPLPATWATAARGASARCWHRSSSPAHGDAAAQLVIGGHHGRAADARAVRRSSRSSSRASSRLRAALDDHGAQPGRRLSSRPLPEGDFTGIGRTTG